LLSLLPLAPLLPPLLAVLAAAGGRERAPGCRCDARGVKVFFLFEASSVAASVPLVFCAAALFVLLRLHALLVTSVISFYASAASAALIVFALVVVVVVIIPARRRRHGPPLGILLDHLPPLDRDAGPCPSRVDRRDPERAPPVEDEVGGHGGHLPCQAPRGPGVARFLFRWRKIGLKKGRGKRNEEESVEEVGV
jgi:hypothetical protein